jgi:hypothetical protein
MHFSIILLVLSIVTPYYVIVTKTKIELKCSLKNIEMCTKLKNWTRLVFIATYKTHLSFQIVDD